ALEQKMVELNIENEVHLSGNIDDVPRHVNDAHIYVHSATYEPFGLAIVEAMSTGLPVVCLDGKGNRILIRNGENGFIVSHSDSEEFSNKILHTVRDESTYRQFCEQARKSALPFDIRTYTDRLIALYQG